MGSRLKLATNHWMISMVAALAESMHLCEAMGLDQQQFIALLDGGPLGSVYAVQKLDEMRRHEYPAGFPVRLALKDLELVREVEQSSRATMPLLDVVLERFMTASQDLADQDLAAIYELDGPATPYEGTRLSPTSGGSDEPVCASERRTCVGGAARTTYAALCALSRETRSAKRKPSFWFHAQAAFWNACVLRLETSASGQKRQHRGRPRCPLEHKDRTRLLVRSRPGLRRMQGSRGVAQNRRSA